jgi:uncharacterized protein
MNGRDHLLRATVLWGVRARIAQQLIVVATLLCAAADALARAPDFETAPATTVMVPMRDKVRLATDIYLPARSGKPIDDKVPTILTRTPYGRTSSDGLGRYYAERGYAVVVQDTRGRYDSEGVWHMLTDDGRDGVDTANWIVDQTWSDGQIGMFGTSYVGGTQHAIALEGCPHLKTVIPVDAMSNLGYASMRNGGAFELRFWNWIFSIGGPSGSRQARDSGTARALHEMMDDRRYYLLNLPLRRGTTPLKLIPEYEDWLVEAMRHGANDEFWAQNNILDHVDRYRDMPVYLVGGWYDSWASNTTANYRALANRLKGPVYLIMGPWTHGGQGGSAHGQVDFGADAAIADPLAWRCEWYDHWLKGRANSVGRDAPFTTPVRIFVMGTGDGRKTTDGRVRHGGTWRDEHEWPLARTRYTNYHLQEDGHLAPESPTAQKSSTSFEFDPRHPVPTIGGNISSGDGILLAGAWDQRGGKHVWNAQEPVPLSARNDVVVFQTSPLETDVEVTGELEVKLWISSTAVDTDFTAKLVDVHPASDDFPAGLDMLVGDGILRTRFRDSLAREVLMQPGTIYQITIRLYPTANIFRRGHRLRIDVSSSNFPRFDVNPNTGEPLNNHRRMMTATNTIHHDAEHPSHVVLPIIPGP